MTRILFLLIPVAFSGLCLLLGETFSWLKQKRAGKDHFKTIVILHSGRK